MNENLNLYEILKHCPVGTKFWSPVWGDVFLLEIKEKREGEAFIPIVITAFGFKDISLFSDGRYSLDEKAECVIFPSKDQRDWSKFKGPSVYVHYVHELQQLLRFGGYTELANNVEIVK